jgi:hypothetical protein
MLYAVQTVQVMASPLKKITKNVQRNSQAYPVQAKSKLRLVKIMSSFSYGNLPQTILSLDAYAYHQEPSHSGFPIPAHNPDSGQSPPQTLSHLQRHSPSKSSWGLPYLRLNLDGDLHVVLDREFQALTNSRRNLHCRIGADR